jgi:hypothetical protein
MTHGVQPSLAQAALVVSDSRQAALVVSDSRQAALVVSDSRQAALVVSDSRQAARRAPRLHAGERQGRVERRVKEFESDRV